MAITPFDYYALGYCIANTLSQWKLCCIGAEGIEMISSALNTNSEIIHGRIALIKLSLPTVILHDLTDLATVN